MKRALWLWLLAFLMTLLSAAYQRLTGPTHPVRGTALIGGEEISYRLNRSHDIGDQPVRIRVGNPSVSGTLIYRRNQNVDDWTRVAMSAEQGWLTAFLPHQPPAGKLIYYVQLSAGAETVRLPAQGEVLTRFKGVVPLTVLIPHIIIMFAVMLVSSRAGLAALAGSTRLKTYSIWTIALIIAGGFVMGPLVQKYAFGAFWTGWPFGTDLTDNKTAIAFLAWIVALGILHRRPPARWWVLAAAIITMLIFLIPHSLLGS